MRLAIKSLKLGIHAEANISENATYLIHNHYYDIETLEELNRALQDIRTAIYKVISDDVKEISQ